MRYGLQASSSINLQNLDLERGALHDKRAATWNPSSSPQVHDIGLKSASVKTTSSWTSSTINIFKRWKSISSEKIGTQDIEMTPRLKACKQFVGAITNNVEITDLAFLNACEWLLDDIENKIRRSWTTLFQPVLRGVSHESDSVPDMTLAFKFLTAVVIEKNKQSNSMALVDFCDPLYSQGFLDDTDDERRDGYQLVFAVLGWTSGLYTSALDDFDLDFVSIDDPSQAPKTARKFYHHIHHRTEIMTKCPLYESTDQPLVDLLDRFGKLLPQPYDSIPQFPIDSWIDESLLSFQILIKIAHIKIEWVEDLAQHLHFDVRSKMLKVYKYPSLCLVLLTNPEASAWLETKGAKIEPRSFYHEVLLTYRLLFESDKHASAQFNRLSSSWKGLLEDPPPTYTNPSSLPAMYKRTVPDPLLLQLCGSYHDAAGPSALFDALGAAPILSNNNYNALHFPYLGARLLKLQEHVKSRTPNSLMALWDDKRVISNWYTLWAVIIVGGGTLLLGLTSVGLQIGGLVLEKQQVDAARQGL